MMGPHDGNGFGWVGWLVFGLLTLAFWALLIFGGMRLFRSRTTAAQPTSPPPQKVDEPRRLLDERFARGEIDEDDYRHRRELLNV